MLAPLDLKWSEIVMTVRLHSQFFNCSGAVLLLAGIALMASAEASLIPENTKSLPVETLQDVKRLLVSQEQQTLLSTDQRLAAERTVRAAEAAIEKIKPKAAETVSHSQDLMGANMLAPPSRQQYLTTVFISESMGESAVEALMKAYEGDSSVRLVLRGFKGEGTLTEGLQWLIRLAHKHPNSPAVVIDPELFRHHEIREVPTFMVESLQTSVVENPWLAQIKRDIAGIFSWQEEKTGKKETTSFLDNQLATAQRSQQTKRQVVLLVSGTANREWALEQLERELPKEPRIGRRGPVYPIWERDFIEVAQERIKGIDWEVKKRAALTRFWKHQAEKVIRLPTVTTASERRINPAFTLTQDIRLPDGTLLHAKGDRFSPFDVLPFTQTLIVFNATDRRQVKTVSELAKEVEKKGQRIKLIATEIAVEDGWKSFESLTKTLDQPLYLLQPGMVERLGLRAVPSMVSGDNAAKRLIVREVLPLDDRSESRLGRVP